MTDQQFQTCPFTVVVDTREQAPYDFRSLKADAKDGGGTLIVPIEQKALETGDYSISGLEGLVTVERKSLEDFLSCCGTDRERFTGQLERLNGFAIEAMFTPSRHYAAVVIEADWMTLHRGRWESKINPKSVTRSLLGWTMPDRFPHVHWFPMPSRRHAEETTFRLLWRYWRMVNYGPKID